MKLSIVSFLVIIASMTPTSAQVILISEDFESDMLPLGWTQTSNADDGGWLLGNSSELESEYWPISDHGNFIATNDDACDCNKSVDYLIMPPLNFSDVTVAALQFQNYFDGGSLFGGTEIATIEYSLDNGTTWEVLMEIPGTEDGLWDVQNIDLSELSGNEEVLLAFHYFDDGEWLFGWGIDDVLLFEPDGLDLALASLNNSTNIAVQNPTVVSGQVINNGAEEINSFDISWTIGGDSFTGNFSGLSIPPLGSYNFFHPEVLEIELSGAYDLIVSISNVNGVSDDVPSNDTIELAIQALEYGVLEFDGFEREYIYYHPTSAPENCPLVFVCHGYTGTAEGIMDYSKFNSVAEENGFAVCYPQGIEDSYGNTFFNVGYDFQMSETVDDVAYLQHLVPYLQDSYSLSNSDIFCTGFSNGGDFCYKLACQASETFKAVAPVAGMILQDIMDDCTPTNEVSIFEIHGTEDDVTYFEGDPENIDGWGAYPSIPATIDFFTELFELNELDSQVLPDLEPGDGSTVNSDKYTLESSCTQVWLYTVNGGGHDWPGAWANMDIFSSNEIWEFFSQLCDIAVGIEDIQNSISTERTLVKIVDVMGRVTEEEESVILFYLYSDGSVDKVVKLK